MAPGTERVRGAYRIVKTLYTDSVYRLVIHTLLNHAQPDTFWKMLTTTTKHVDLRVNTLI